MVEGLFSPLYGPSLVCLSAASLANSCSVPSSGCAFVTYCSKQSAELAQQGLHDKLLLPGVRTWPLSLHCCLHCCL